MYNPYSGNRLENLIFIGPIYYQRLRHLVDDKMYARSRGTVVALTRQPTHGRSRGGGLRFGEMERDCILAHGISKFLQERTFKVADMFRVHVCSRCGLMAEANLERNSFRCRYCMQIKVLDVFICRKEGIRKFIRFKFLMLRNYFCRNLWLCIFYLNCTSNKKLPPFDQ